MKQNFSLFRPQSYCSTLNVSGEPGSIFANHRTFLWATMYPIILRSYWTQRGPGMADYCISAGFCWSLPQPHDLLVVHRAQLGSHRVKNEPIIWWKKRKESGADICIQVVVLTNLRGGRLSSHLLVASAVCFSSTQQQTASSKVDNYSAVCIPLLRHISLSLISQVLSVLNTDRRICFKQIFEPLQNLRLLFKC